MEWSGLVSGTCLPNEQESAPHLTVQAHKLEQSVTETLRRSRQYSSASVETGGPMSPSALPWP